MEGDGYCRELEQGWCLIRMDKKIGNCSIKIIINKNNMMNQKMEASQQELERTQKLFL